MGQRPESVKELQCTSRVSAMAILLVTITSKIQCKPWACSCVLPSYGGGCGGGATFWRSPVTYAIGHFSPRACPQYTAVHMQSFSCISLGFLFTVFTHTQTSFERRTAA